MLFANSHSIEGSLYRNDIQYFMSQEKNNQEISLETFVSFLESRSKLNQDYINFFRGFFIDLLQQGFCNMGEFVVQQAMLNFYLRKSSYVDIESKEYIRNNFIKIDLELLELFKKKDGLYG